MEIYTNTINIYYTIYSSYRINTIIPTITINTIIPINI